jgi:hypothetical protein
MVARGGRVFEELSIEELERRRAEAQGQIERYWRVYCSLVEFRLSDLKVAQSTGPLLIDIRKRLSRLWRMDAEIARRVTHHTTDELP